MKVNVILYVKDQRASRQFYEQVLGHPPTLDVPGMTEFALCAGCVLGLMPEAGAMRLLGGGAPDPATGSGIPRAELYLTVDAPEMHHRRALKAGARELSPLLDRGWGDQAAYSIDPDGHILAFAKANHRKAP
jgi:catechol 2,3-dioxygenase-like lactoylglutathione lyase family enzyme